ncbi:dentin sialophosphoprotein-like [Haliotis cracherodii]|uniref:dentin sialophosphoprotein-like n=1 Tax=Haliotis cracherodii TaxID=6455 RepID=UPI0039E7F170
MLCPSESWVNLDDPPCPDTDAVIPSSPTMRSTSLICPTPRSSIFYNSILQQFEQPISFPSFIPSQYLNIHNAGFFSPNTSVLHSDYPNFTSNCTDTNDLPSMFLLESRHVFPSRNHTSLPADTSARSIVPSPCDMSLPAGTSASMFLSPCDTSLPDDTSASIFLSPCDTSLPAGISASISQTSIRGGFVDELSPPYFMSVTICSGSSLSQTSLGPDFDDSTFRPLHVDSECSVDQTAISQILVGPDFDDSSFQPLPIDSACSLDQASISQTSLGPDFDDSSYQPLPVDSACNLDQASISQTSLGPDFDDSTFSSECNLSQDYSQILMKSIVGPFPGSSDPSLSQTISQVSSIEDFSESILIAYSFQL